MKLHYVYSIPFLANSQRQGTAGSDRPLCAAVSAMASKLLGCRLGGAATGLSDFEMDRDFAQVFDDALVPRAYASRWARSIAHLSRIPSRHLVRTVGPMTLSNYQLHALENLTDSGAVLNLGCGLGKTVTTVAAILSYVNAGMVSNSRCWIVCPLNAMPAWEPYKTILAQHFESVAVISVDSLHRHAQGIPAIGGVVVFDEVHLLGDPGRRRTEAAHLVRRNFEVGLSLTGTLRHGGVRKALSVLDLTVPGAAWFANLWKCGEYFRCLVKKKIGRRSVTDLARPVGPARDAFFDFVDRMTIAMNARSEIVRQDFELPEQHLHTLEVGDCSVPLEVLAADYIRAEIEAGEEMPTAAAVAHHLAASGSAEKIALLLDEIDDGGDEPLVVFANYTATMDAAAAALTEAGISFVRVDGTVTGPERGEAQRKFQDGEVRVFLGQLHASCVGMNLFRGCTSVALDHNWSGTDYSQLLARTCRRGQTSVCHHIDFATNKFQLAVIKRLREAENFDSEAMEYQDIRRTVCLMNPPPT